MLKSPKNQKKKKTIGNGRKISLNTNNINPLRKYYILMRLDLWQISPAHKNNELVHTVLSRSCKVGNIFNLKRGRANGETCLC